MYQKTVEKAENQINFFLIFFHLAYNNPVLTVLRSHPKKKAILALHCTPKTLLVTQTTKSASAECGWDTLLSKLVHMFVL